MLLSEIARKFEFDMQGEDRDITGIAYFDEAKETDLAVVFKREDINRTHAKAVLAAPTFLETNKTLLTTYESLEWCMVRICRLMMNAGMLADYGKAVEYQLSERGYYTGKNCKISLSAQISPGVMIGDDVVVGEQCRLDAFTVIGSGTVLEDNVHIGAGSKIGMESFFHYCDETGEMKPFQGCGKVVIGKDTHVGCNTVIQRGTISDTVIGSRCMIGNSIDIGHDVKVGDDCKIVSQTGIAGGAVLKNCVQVFGQVGISNNVVIGNNAIIKGKTAVSKSVRDDEIIWGPFGREYYDELRLQAKIRKKYKGKDA